MAFVDRPLVEQLALRYCAPRGIPLSVFLEGRAPMPGQSPWAPADVHAALEWQAWEDGKCPGCGQPSEESMQDIDDAPPYKAEVIACHACIAKSMEENVMANDGHSGAGLYTIVRKAG